MVEMYILAGLGAATASVVAYNAAKTVWRKVLRSKVKGHAGESKVRKILKSFAKNGGRAKNDILIPGKLNTAQIDHLLINRHGIFVIETKNYSGMIQGWENSNLWRQIFPDGKSAPRDFKNPIKQNNGHIGALRAILGEEYKNVPMHSIVVFPDKTVFPQLPGVFSFGELKNAIRYLSNGDPVLSQEKVDDISRIIDKNLIDSSKARSIHNVRASFSAAGNDQRAINELIEENLQHSTMYLRTTPIPSPFQKENEVTERALLTDIRAKLKIRGRTDTIDGFFEAAKRNEDGQSVPPGSNFDHFICPFTGDKFPASEAINMYRGLWITYLNENPNLVSYMKENGTENLGNSFRCKKVLNLYVSDNANFVADVKRSEWYQNMAAKLKKRSVDTKIQSASKTVYSKQQRSNMQYKTKEAQR